MRLAAFTIGAVSIFGLAACTSTETTSDDTSIAQNVASQYMNDFTSGNFPGAASFIASDSLGPFQAIVEGLGPHSLLAMNLRASSSRRNGDQAQVSFVGTMCSTGDKTSLPNPIAPTDTRCIVSSTATDLPGPFLVSLKLQSGTWKVFFDVSAAAPSHP